MKHGILIEFKGRFTGADRTKMLRIKEQHPGLDLRIVFQQNQRLYKGSPNYYVDWAKKHGFKYHIGISLPKEWIEELK